MSEEELDTLDYAEEMWKVVVHQVKDNVIAIAALWLSKRVLQEVSEAVAAEREACAELAENLFAARDSDGGHDACIGEQLAAAIRARAGEKLEG